MLIYLTCKITVLLTHWGRVMHICVSNLTIIGSDNGWAPGQHQAIIWTNAGIFSIGPSGTNFSEILIEIHTFLFKNMHLKKLSAKWQSFRLCLNVLIFILFYQRVVVITWMCPFVSVHQSCNLSIFLVLTMITQSFLILNEFTKLVGWS